MRVLALPERRQRGGERVDDRLVASALFERLGERDEPAHVAGVLRDELSRRAFGRVQIAHPPLGLRQEEERGFVVAAHRHRLAQRRARLRHLLLAAEVHQRRGVADPEVGAARRHLQRLLVGARRLAPLAFARVEVGERRIQLGIVLHRLFEPADGFGAAAGRRVGFDEQRRAVLPLRLLLDELGEDRNRLVVAGAADVEARQHRAKIGVGAAHRTFDRLLEMLDRLGDVLALGVAVRPLPLAGRRRRHRRVERPEHAMGLPIRGRDLQRLLGRRHGLGHAVLAHEQIGELRHNLGRLRIERHRALVGRDRAVDVVVVFEPMRQQELRVGLSHRIRLNAQGPAPGVRSVPHRPPPAPRATRGGLPVS